MPWTPRQVRYLLSSGSPLSGGQKEKMQGELHASPAMSHAKKGSGALSDAAKQRGKSQSSTNTSSGTRARGVLGKRMIENKS